MVKFKLLKELFYLLLNLVCLLRKKQSVVALDRQDKPEKNNKSPEKITNSPPLLPTAPKLVPKVKPNPWTNTLQKREQEEINSDQWFTHPGDQTLTRYKINGDTLESERIVESQPSAGSRRAFRNGLNESAKNVQNALSIF